MRWRAVKDHIIIDLLVFRHAQTAPGGPDSINAVLSTAVKQRLEGTSTGVQIDAVEAIETGRTLDITGTNKIALMAIIDVCGYKGRIGFALGLVILGAFFYNLMMS